MSHPPPIDLQDGHEQAGIVVLCPEGDLDRAGARACVTQLRAAVAAQPSAGVVVIDLDGICFLGVSGIHALLGFAAESAERGVSTRFLLPARHKRIIMRIGLSSEFARFAPIQGTPTGS